jgi:hypothetical protein
VLVDIQAAAEVEAAVQEAVLPGLAVPVVQHE